jgi:hypothetical protein
MKMDLNLWNKYRIVSAIITTEGGGDGDAGDNDDSGSNADGADNSAGGGDSGSQGQTDDLSALFTAEEIAAKKENAVQTKAEEARRAALSPEELKAEDDLKAAEAAKSVVPEKYAPFKLADGTEPDAETFAKWGEFAKANGFTQAQMEQVTAEGMKLFSDVRQKQFETVKTDWLNAAQKDSEIGEDIKKGADSAAARAFNTLATPELKQVMEQYGLGNHPEMLRMFFRLSKSFKEDTFEGGGSGSGLDGGKSSDKTAGSIFNHPSRQKA